MLLDQLAGDTRDVQASTRSMARKCTHHRKSAVLSIGALVVVLDYEAGIVMSKDCKALQLNTK